MTPAVVVAWLLRLQLIGFSLWVAICADLPTKATVTWGFLAWIFWSAANGIEGQDS